MLEDCHWIDELSRDLLQRRSSARAPACASLFVLAYRPTREPRRRSRDREPAAFDELALDRMDDDDAAAVVRSKMEQVLGPNGELPSDELVDAGGRPVRRQPALHRGAPQLHRRPGHRRRRDPAAMRSLQLPESLHTLVLSRIDTVAEGPRRTMKVASVVGRVFEAPMLPGAYEELGALDDVVGHLDALRTADLVAPRPRGGPGLDVQARGDPGGRLREHAVRAARGPPPASSATTSRRPSRTRSSATSTSSRTTTGTATTSRRSASTWVGQRPRRRRATRTPPRSTTTSGCSHWSKAPRASTRRSSSPKCSS